MTPEVEQAIAEIKRAFDGHPVDTEPEPQGGAYIRVHNLLIGEQYVPTTSWVGFQVGFQYPYADVYPHFTDGSLRRADGRALGNGFSSGITWQKQQVIRLSRRSNRWNPAIDTAATKLTKVLAWVRYQ